MKGVQHGLDLVIVEGFRNANDVVEGLVELLPGNFALSRVEVLLPTVQKLGVGNAVAGRDLDGAQVLDSGSNQRCVDTFNSGHTLSFLVE